MKFVLGLLIVYLFFPYLGLFNYDGFGGRVTNEMKILYILHIFIELSIIMFFLFILYRSNFISINSNNYIYKYNVKKVIKKSIILLIIAIFINFFIFGNYKILFGIMGRGEFRTTLHLGFIYNFLSFFFPGAILTLNTHLYSRLPLFLRKKFKMKIIILFILAMMLGFLTGFKSTAIFIAIMGLIGLSPILNIKHIILTSIIFIFIMAISGYLFMHFENFNQVFFYLLKRATSIAVDGTVGVYNNFPDGAKDSYLILLYIFGNKLASFITGWQVNSLEYLQIDLGRHIAYLTYPSKLTDEALSGAFNLTITNFGEAIYLFGKNYFYIYSLLIGLIISLIFFLYIKGDIKLKVVLSVYFITSVVIGGGRITNIFAVTTFIYLLGVYLIITFILNTSLNKEYKYVSKNN